MYKLRKNKVDLRFFLPHQNPTRRQRTPVPITVPMTGIKIMAIFTEIYSNVKQSAE